MSETSLRWRLAGVGAVAALFGLVATIDPALARAPAADALVKVVGLGGVVIGSKWTVEGLRTRGPEELVVPPVECRTGTRVPGDDIDYDLTALDPGIRDRLETLATDAVSRQAGCARDTARERIERGDWTDDSRAAAFFSPEAGAADAHTPGLRAALAGQSQVDPIDQATQAIGAIAALVRPDKNSDVPSLPDRQTLRERLAFTVQPVTSGSNRRSGQANTAITRTDGGSAWTRDGSYPEASDGLVGVPPVGETLDRNTDRWRGLGGVALVAAGLGTVLQVPGLLVVAGIFAGVTAYATADRVTKLPSIDVTVDRELSTHEPAPGEPVRVDVTIHNAGAAVSDLEFVDGVPTALEVADGSPRLDASLDEGETASCTYEVVAESGVHEFEPGVVVVRSPFGQRERVCRVSTEGAITCSIEPAAQRVDPQDATERQSGLLPTESGGEGVEFYGTREYRRSDPMGLIDWQRFAATGELRTIEFRESKSTTVLLVVDGRWHAYVARDLGGRSAVRVGAEGAAKLATGLMDGGNLVGLTALSPHDDPLWVPPSAGRTHRTRIREALTTHPALSPTPPDGLFLRAEAIARLRARVQGDAEIVLVSPLTDDGVCDVVESLLASDYAVTVISPDVTRTDTPGRVVAAIQRRLRCSRLRAAGAAVYDWDVEDGLAVSLERGMRRRRQ
jgi:uncharacterized protein (DUF58 family)